jgi:hypothetical protein
MKAQIAIGVALAVCLAGLVYAAVTAPPETNQVSCPRCRHEFEMPKKTQIVPIMIPIPM